MRCPHCKNEHTDDSQFCPITGKAIPLPVTLKNAETTLICKNCKARLTDEARFCPDCGVAVTISSAAGQNALQVNRFFKWNNIKLAGIGVILLIIILEIKITFGGKPKDISLQLPIATQTQTFLKRQATASLTFISTKTEIPETLPEPQILIKTLSNSPPLPRIQSQSPIPFPTKGISCRGAPPIRVKAGDLVHVTTTEGDKLILRSSPEVDDNMITMLLAGIELRIIDGPVCSDNFSYWEIKIPGTIQTGWVAEGDNSLYYIEPIY